ncbi:MAG: hypothetical protein L0216_14680 [Planctomycetales bacterium]|nr:hypothetical protein [Planctomycetales bacterium]
MPAVFAYLGPRATAAASLVAAGRSELEGGERAPGWGVAWLAGETGDARAGAGVPGEDAAYAAAAGEAIGDAVLAALGVPGRPIRFFRWLFAADVRLPALSGLRERIHEDVPEPLRGQVPTGSDAEALLALFLATLQRLAPGGPPSADVLRAAVAASLARAERIAADAWASERPAAALVATDGEVLAAARRGLPLSWRPVPTGGLYVSTRPFDREAGWLEIGPDAVLSATAAGGVVEAEELEAAAARGAPRRGSGRFPPAGR